MLGYVVLKAKEDIHIKTDDSVFIFKKDNIYVAKYHHNDIKVFDERDNACEFGYFQSCMRVFRIPHYTVYFDLVDFKSAINGKEFYNIRKQLREGEHCNE